MSRNRGWQAWFGWTDMQLKKPARRRTPRQRRLETLEKRELLAGDLRSFDGTGNNLVNPEWGSTSEQFLRIAPADYGDGISTPAGSDRASAREISNLLAAHPDGALINDRNLSAFVYAWGQFLDHDIDLTETASPAESFPIPVPADDASFDPAATGTKTIGLTRSEYDPATGTAINNVRQQVNRLTAFIDASQIYGSDAERATTLRTLSGGQLKTSAGDLLPYNTLGLANATVGGPAEAYFVAGDVRANENAELIAMQTLFVREHNRLADELATQHPDWNDEQLYQQSRRIVIGEVQAITYNEFLPALLGQNALKPYRGYNPAVNPGISNEFAAAAFRLGHSLLGDDIEFLNNDGEEVREAVGLRDAFFNPSLIADAGIDTVLKYLASDRAEELDTKVVDDVRNFLFGPPGAGGLDLASLNIQRGRDHGLADYNSVRAAYGLPKVTDFADITSDVATQDALRAAYGDVDSIDLWVGGLAEEHARGASVGPLFQRILADQFSRLRDGDRFWYERDLQGRELDQVRHTSLADVIRRNTTTTNLQENVFFFHPQISGRVYFDANNNGQAERRETGIGGQQVRLLDAAGQEVATARTKRDGSYQLDVPDLGEYTVVVSAPRGLQVSSASESIAVTSGRVIPQVDVGLGRTSQGKPQGSSEPPAGPRPPAPLAPPAANNSTPPMFPLAPPTAVPSGTNSNAPTATNTGTTPPLPPAPPTLSPVAQPLPLPMVPKPPAPKPVPPPSGDTTSLPAMDELVGPPSGTSPTRPPVGAPTPGPNSSSR